MKKLLPSVLLVGTCAPRAPVVAVDQMAGTDFLAYHAHNFSTVEARNTLVWQGRVAGPLTKKADRQLEQINNGAAALFARYPVPMP